jgi:hypothetical protein
MKINRWIKLIEGLGGIVLAAAATAVVATQELLPWNPITQPWLIAGGIFGLLVGVIMGLAMPLKTRWAIAAGLVGAGALYGLNRVIYQAGDFAFKEGVIVALAFAMFWALFYLSVSLVTLLEMTPWLENERSPTVSR